MAKIIVKFYSLWNLYLNKKEVPLEVDNLDEAMEKLEILFGDQLRKQLKSKKLQFENFKNSSTVLVNGVSLRNIKNRNLKDGDVLHIFPPIAGG